MVTDLWALRVSDAPEVILLDVPTRGTEGLSSHLAKYLPPRFASVEDVSAEMGALTLVGPQAAEAALLAVRAASRTAGGGDGCTETASHNQGGAGGSLAGERPAGSTDLAYSPMPGNSSPIVEGERAVHSTDRALALDPGEWIAPSGDTEALVIMRTSEVWPSAYTILGPRGALDVANGALARRDVPEGSLDAWRTLRLEADHSPAFGIDMDEKTIPVEAGIHDCGIDYRKGCYTGQEVIIRIRDRGRVNRHLRRLRLGDAAVPPPGAELAFGDAPGSDGPTRKRPTRKAAGHVTSAAWSPRYGETIALAYVRREATEVLLDGRAFPIESSRT